MVSTQTTIQLNVNVWYIQFDLTAILVTDKHLFIAFYFVSFNSIHSTRSRVK